MSVITPDEGSSATGTPPLSALIPFSITITSLMANTLINPALPDVVRDLAPHWSPGPAAGLIVAMGSVFGPFMAPVVGVLADRVGRRAVLVPSLVLFGVAGSLTGLSPNLTTLLVLRSLAGIGGAGLMTMAVVLISDHWPSRRRAVMLGRNSAVLTVNIALLPALGGLLAELGSWRYTALPFPFALLAAWWTARALPPTPKRKDRPPLLHRSQRPPLDTRLIGRAAALAFTSFVLIFGLFLATMPEHLERHYGLSAGWRGLILAVPATGSTIAALLIGPLRRFLSPHLLVTFGLGAFAAGFALTSSRGFLVLVLAGSFLYGCGEGLVLPTLQDAVASSTGPENRGLAVSLYFAAVRAGQVVGPLLAGQVIARGDTSTAWLAGGAVALAAAITQLRWRVAATERTTGTVMPPRGSVGTLPHP